MKWEIERNFSITDFDGADTTLMNTFGFPVVSSGQNVIVGDSNYGQGAGVAPAAPNGAVFCYDKYNNELRNCQFIPNPDIPTAPPALGTFNFGSSVCVTGKLLIVGAQGNTSNRGQALGQIGGFNTTGVVYVFRKVNSRYKLIQGLDGSDLATAGVAGSNVTIFGQSITVEGNHLFISFVQGAVAVRHYVFEAGEFKHVEVITQPSVGVNTPSGTLSSFTNIAFHNNILALGVIDGNYTRQNGTISTIGAGPGAVYIYRLTNGRAKFQQSVYSTLLGIAAAQSFGYTVKFIGNSLFVGAPGATQAGQVNAGNAFIFKPTGKNFGRIYDSEDENFRQEILAPTPPVANTYFGAFATSDSHITLGIGRNNFTGLGPIPTLPGQLHLYRKNHNEFEKLSSNILTEPGAGVAVNDFGASATLTGGGKMFIGGLRSGPGSRGLVFLANLTV